MQAFALIGAAGYVAPKHMRAIADTGNQLVCAVDNHDSVGVLDSHFPQAQFFTEFERFDRHVDKLRRNPDKRSVDYVSICSPNYLHDAHIRFALRSGAHAVCEKPLVLNPWNIDNLRELEEETGRRVHTILQLRLHPAIVALREKVVRSDSVEHDVDLTYITSRGNWYQHSWKGDDRKSGGIATNIGIHFFDMLGHVFGPLRDSEVHFRSAFNAAGAIRYENARVRWLMSIDSDMLPASAVEAGQPTFRSIRCDDEEVEFSSGFADLHTESYRNLLAGGGFGLDDARQAVETVAAIREADIHVGSEGTFHPRIKDIRR